MPFLSLFFHGGLDALKSTLADLLPKEDLKQDWSYTNGYYILYLNGFNVLFKATCHSVGLSYKGNVQPATGLSRKETEIKVKGYWIYLLESKKFTKEECNSGDCHAFDFA